ncbi:MAG: glutamate synthase (NADPH), homotetrameric [Deltaproteobacteria bacterium RBG_13_61_14]|nr:MAG: glutamate synthase (NADPH), homotetrameric [Deltaproteobacteria bacterium RBG_13_61_14]
MNEKPEQPKKPKKEKIPRQKMAEQDPRARIQNFDEVPYGFTEDQAKLEASRCLQCKKSKCRDGCPVDIDIPAFLKLIQEGEFIGAARKIKEQNALPAICGRVCPQEEQCEKLCLVGKKDQPVSIGYLERFAADFERNSGKIFLPAKRPPTGKRVAVVGSGPAGLTVAGELIKLGHQVTIFEALHKTGGVLVYGIPEFRLPKAVVQAEVDYLKAQGVEIQTSAVVGQSVTVDELLRDGFDAVFIGTGAGLPMFMNVPGENLNGVYSANEYLTRSNLMKAYLFPQYDTPIIKGKRVAVIGGGNVAMDSARTALRLGADKSMIIYRRSRVEMPARVDEVEHAEEEGVEFHLLTLPLEIKGDERGYVKSMICQKMELGEPDQSGRRRPVPIKGSEYEIAVDTVVVAIGNNPNPLVPKTTPDIQLHKWGGIVADEETGKTSKDAVYAGGDIVTGAATVILAMGAGKKAARAIHKQLTGEDLTPPQPSGGKDNAEE